MMRPARTASLLVVLSLLTSAAAAHAECAWVLWGSATVLSDPKSRTSVDPAGGYGNKDECVEGMAALIRAAVARSTNEVRIIDDGASVIIHSTDKPSSVARVTYSCLPDTVDPRGPKGSR